MSFGDLKVAAQMRDLIEHISGVVVDKKRPEVRIGTVHHSNVTDQLAWVMFPGDTEDNLTKVRVALNMLPTKTMVTNPGEPDVVRVAGRPGNYYVIDFIKGVPQSPDNIPLIDVNFNGQRGINLGDPVDPQDATTKSWTQANFATPASVASKEPAIAPGEVTQYFRGDKNWALLDKSAVGLGSVDNTSDANKPISTAAQNALNLKAPLASPAFTGTPTGITKAHVGLGNVDNTADTAKPVSTAQQNALNLKANLASPTFTGTVGGITKAMVGLGNADNTSDANKPVSTAQAAINAAKADLVGGVIPDAQLPPLAILDTFVANSQAAMLALTAQKGDVAVRTDVNRTFRLSASPASTLANWIEMPAAGAVTSVAGKTGTVALVKGDVGLGNVDNTADTAKPVSTAQQTALNLKANLASPTFTGTVGGITKSMVGLGNVDNTSDADKPISTAQGAVNALKANDVSVVHTTLDEQINGLKTFGSALRFDQQALTPATPPAGDNQIYFKSDGLPYYMGADGVERPFIITDGALHVNPSFEAFNSDGIHPTGWGSFWRDSAVTPATWSQVDDQSSPGSGSKAFEVTVPPSAQGRFSISVLDVMPGQLFTFAIWAKKIVGGADARIGVTCMTRATGTPNFFDSATTQQGTSKDPTTSWARYVFSWIVPEGHTRLTVDINSYSTSNSTLTMRFDNSTSKIESISTNTGVPAGTISMWPLGTMPAGYLRCDGTIYNIADYPTLGALYGNTYGGNGTTTFGVPNIVDRRPVGAGTKGLGSVGGTNTTTIAAANLPATINMFATGSAGGGSAENSGLSIAQGATGGRFNHPVSLGYANTAMDTQDPWFGIHFIVKT